MDRSRAEKDRFLSYPEVDFGGLYHLKKSISARLFLLKVHIFVAALSRYELKAEQKAILLPHPALKIFQFIGLCKKQ